MKTLTSSALLLLVALLPACGEHLVKFQDPVVPPGTPTVISTVPASAATGVLLNADVTATFSEAMTSTTLTTTTFTLAQAGTPVAGAVSYAAGTATFNPTADLSPGLLYTATITTGAQSQATNTPLASNYVWTFTTAATPTVLSTVPANLATGVLVNANVTATFSTAMTGTTLTATTFTLAQAGTSVAGAVSYAAGTATFNPTADLSPGLLYTATITTGAQSSAGVPLATSHVWTFTTAVVVPTVTVVTPLNLAIDVPVNTDVTATFSEAMNGTTLTLTTFTLTQAGASVGGAVSYAAGTATFNPTVNLSAGLVYTATITTGAQSLASNTPLASDYIWTFTTAAAPPPVVVNMGLAASYGLAATAGITNTITAPNTIINGDVILDPNQTCNAVVVDNAGGFGLCDGMAPTINSGVVVTNTYPDSATAPAVRADLNAAFISITPPAGQPAAGLLGGAIDLPAGTTLGNSTGSAEVQGDNLFAPGVYQSLTSILITDDIVLDGGGDANATWVFQSNSSLTTADGAATPGAHARVILRNGAKASNVWWQVASSATLGLFTEFNGNILAAFDITMKTGATSCGRSMAGAWVGGTGAFVLDSNVISVPGNASAPLGCN
jgi:hypothetical protein